MTDEDVAATRISQLEQVWTSVSALGAELAAPEWDLPTDLPGWTVKDCLSHLTGTERGLLGDPAPEVAIDHLEHIRNPFAAAIETWVEARRPVPGPDVLAEWDHVAARRLEALRAMGPEEWSRVGWTPVGDGPYGLFMEVRVFDSWMHEQDIRRATGRPGHLDGPCVEVAMGRIRAGLGFVVGKRAGAPEGAVVTFEVSGPGGGRFPVRVEGGRAQVVAAPGPEPTVTLAMDVETFCALGGGRWQGADVLASGRAQVLGDRALGDRALGEAVLTGMAITP